MRSTYDSRSGPFHRVASTAALTLLLIALWSLTHRYLGFDGDAKLYAVQALAKIHGGLANDLFLQNVSQDRFTIFSSFYSWCIKLFGLSGAELALTVAFKIWFLAAAWSLARAISTPRIAFLATATLIIVVGRYGAFSVFQYSEDWLTARSLAEPLVITSLACHFHGRRIVALLIAVGTLFVHPLLALPGLLLLLCLWAPTRISIATAAIGILVSLAITFLATLSPMVAHAFPVMDTSWLEMVEERSQFLFLEIWSVNDWKLNAQPFISLTISTLCFDEPKIRKFCLSAMLVGATGLALARVANCSEPVAMFLQGQPWRWVWVTTFSAVLLLIPTASQVWRDNRCGPLCALLLVGSWTFTPIDGALCACLALALWLVRNRVTPGISSYLQWATIAVASIVVIWIVANCWTIAWAPHIASVREPAAVAVTKSMMTLDALPLLAVGILGYWVVSIRSAAQLVAICAALLAASAVLIPTAFRQNTGKNGAVTGTDEFADWRLIIPPDSNVLVVPSPISASFAWFMLERPSYLSADQSSGVVFSRETAQEIRRRAEVVLPLWDTNWRLRSQRKAAQYREKIQTPTSRPLTRDALLAVCHDPKLKYVVAKEDIGFGAVRHTHAGIWKDWNLYGCQNVNSAPPPA